MRILIKKDPRYPINLKRVRQITSRILDEKKWGDKVEISLNFVGKRKAKKLNKEYRRKDYIPEVLAFPMGDTAPDGKVMIGDVVICYPLARAEARRRERLVIEIIAELLEHGIGNLNLNF